MGYGPDFLIELIFFFFRKCLCYILSSVVNILLCHLLKYLLEIANLPPNLFYFFALKNILLFCLLHLFWS